MSTRDHDALKWITSRRILKSPNPSLAKNLKQVEQVASVRRLSIHPSILHLKLTDKMLLTR